MRHSLPLLSALLLPLLSAASPNPTPSPALPVRAAITAPPSRRDENFAPSIAPLSLNLPTISIAKPSIASFSLDLPPETCTPGFSSYATPGLDGYVPADACNALWVYFPNFTAAVAFSVLFGILTIAHLAQAILYRNGICWVIIMAALWETCAYAFRALGSKSQQSSGIATVAQILVLVAPIWVNAFAYMVFARVVHFYSPTRKVWFFSPTVLALIFVTLDMTAFVIQLVGGGACWRLPFVLSTALPNSPQVSVQATHFRVTNLFCTSWSRHQCGWPFSCGTSFIPVVSYTARTLKCRLRGSPVISAAAVANVAAKTATSELRTTAWWMIWNYTST
jgi:hypothetical protein